MEKKIFLKIKLGRLAVAICVFMLITSMATALGNSTSKEKTGISTLSYTFLFEEPSLKSTQADGSTYTVVDMQGCMAIGKQIGDPNLPVKFVQFLLPAGTAVESVTVTGEPVEMDLGALDLTAQQVYPYQSELPIGSNVPQEFAINDAVYSSSALYPSEAHGAYDVGYSHGYAIFDMGLSPVQYAPGEGRMLYYPQMTVTINLCPADYVNPFFGNNAEDAAWVGNLVSNPEVLYTYGDLPVLEYPGGLCDPSDSYDYVIITTTQNELDYWAVGGTLTYNWESLMNKHTGDGLSSTLVTVQDIQACTDYQNSDPLFNDQPAHIREFCKDAYEDWGTRYILIAGDSDTIGARQLYYDYEGNVDSDIYWSNLDLDFNADHDSYWGEEGDSGFDVYAELYIGRVVCDEPQDVSNWLTKSFYYADSTDYTYLDNAAFYGGDLGWNCQGDDFVDYSAIKTTTNWLGPIPGAHGAYPSWLGFQYGFETWNAMNEGNQYDLSVKWTAEPPNPGGWQGGSTSAAINGLKAAINSDQVTLISGIAHANPSMSLDVYDSEWDSQYTNTKPFFIHDYGCHCGDFNDGDGVLESMLFHSDTELAFACVYNTGYGWGAFDDTNSSSALQQKLFWDYLFDTTNHSSISDWQLGKAHAFSKDEMAPTLDWTYSSAPGSWRGVIECCLLFGDPAQTIKTASPSDPPAQPSKPAGKNMGIWFAEYTYTSSATDPNGDELYYVFDWNDGTSTTVGPYTSGQTGVAAHTWTELGTYEVKVKARDSWGAGSIWSEPLLVTITDNMAPDAPVVDGPTNVKPLKSYLYTITVTDPEEQNIYLDIDWGDGNGQYGIGPYLSGKEIPFNHAWNAKGTYTLKVKAKDAMGGETDWVILDITVSLARARGINKPLFLEFLERFPNAFPLLRHIMGA